MGQYSEKIAQTAAVGCGYAKLVEFIEAHKNEIKFVGVLNRSKLLNEKANSPRPYPDSVYEKSFDIIYNKQYGYVNGIHQEILRKLFFEATTLSTSAYKQILYLDETHKVNLIIIITSRSFNADNLISHDIISFDDHYCNNVRAFDCMISNVDEYNQIPVNPVEDIDKKISHIKHQRFKNKVKEAMLEIIVNLIFGIVGLIILNLLTWGFYCIGNAIFTLDMTPFHLLGISIPKGIFKLATASFILSSTILATFVGVSIYHGRRV